VVNDGNKLNPILPKKICYVVCHFVCQIVPPKGKMYDFLQLTTLDYFYEEAYLG
jgi:hypothetical protein